MNAWLVLLMMAAQSAPTLAEKHPEPGVTWQELARLPFHGDTIVARGLCLVRSPSDITFLSYRIEGMGGRVWAEDTVPCHPDAGEGEDTWELSCQLSPLGNGFVAVLTRCYYPSYPDCSPDFRYVVTSGASVAISDWTQVEWAPVRGGVAELAVEKDCVSYGIPLVVKSERGRISFSLGHSNGVAVDQERRVRAVNGRWCVIWDQADTTRMIDSYETSRSERPRPLKVSAGERIEVLSAWVRMKGNTPDDIEVEPRRIEARIGGARVFLSPDAMTSLGFDLP